jgi:hypothetical protein
LTKADQCYCKEEIIKYLAAPEGLEKDTIRNNLFLFMEKELGNWVKSILNSLGVFSTKQLVLSLSWDCFVYCLHTYRKLEVPLGFHFYRNSRYCILKDLRTKKSQSIISYGEFEITADRQDEAKFLDLKDFVHHLPEKYKPVFQDAVMSMYHGSRARSKVNWNKEEMNYVEYKSVKAVLISVISYLTH